VKIGCAVDFPVKLDLADFMFKKSMPGTVYDLFGVVNHHGNVGGGHYTADAVVTPAGAEDLADGVWFNFNDSIVKQASPDRLDKEAAYLLFYRRRL